MGLLRRLLLFGTAMLFFSVCSWAQTATTSLKGTISDSQGVQLNTEDASLGTAFNASQIASLPFEGRD